MVSVEGWARLAPSHKWRHALMSAPMAVLVLLSLIAGLWTVFAFVGTALGWFLAGTLVGSLCRAPSI
jgi:uncharacterized membrane protein YqjE